MPDIAKRHHTVPRFYLRGFADENERITTVRLPGDKQFTQTIDKTSTINHFYSVDDHPGGRDAFEKALSGIETSAAPILQSIVEGVWPLPEAQRVELGYFLAMQSVRGTGQRKNIGHIFAQMIRLEASVSAGDRAQSWVKGRLGLDVSAEEAATILKRAANPQGPYTVPPLLHLKQMAELPEKLTKYFIGRPWTLVRFNARALITSDSPVGLVSQPDSIPEMGVGFMTAWGITFPVTRKLGLVMSDIAPLVEANVSADRAWAGEFDRTQKGTTAYEKLINETTADSAAEYVYHHPDDSSFVPRPLDQPIFTEEYVDER